MEDIVKQVLLRGRANERVLGKALAKNFEQWLKAMAHAKPPYSGSPAREAMVEAALVLLAKNISFKKLSSLLKAEAAKRHGDGI